VARISSTTDPLPIRQREAARDDLVAPPSDDDNAVTMRIPRKPQGAAAAIIRHWARDDIRTLVAALQKFLDTPVMQ
jgi:hypothetical protein